MKSNHVRLLIGLCIIGGLIVLRLTGLHAHITLALLKQNADALYHFVQHNYAVSIVGYCALFIGATVAMLPITAVLTVAGGFLFGTWFGAVYAIFTATIGSVLLCLLVRYVVHKWAEKQKYGIYGRHMSNELEVYGGWYVIVAQLLPFTPSPFINIAAGMSKFSVTTFGLATAVGIAPGTLIYTWAGTRLHTIHALTDVITISVFGLLCFFALGVLSVLVWRKMANEA